MPKHTKTTKGIILAGGSGTRLYPLTLVLNKQLLPIHDKPMIFYPLSILMLAGIREILIISTPENLPNFKKLLGNGDNFGLKLSYATQPIPNGLANSFIIGEKFIGKDNVVMILGDNIFYGNGLTELLKEAKNNTHATIFGYYVNDPERFGVIGFNKQGKVTSIEEKPKKAKSNYIATGLYFYDNRVIDFAKKVKPSARGEFEITSINQMYLDNGDLDVKFLGRGFAWFDTGTTESLTRASDFIRIIEEGQNIKIAVLEEIAYKNGWISNKKLTHIAEKYSKSDYGAYLKKVAEGKIKY
ncbi:MAG: glucose-1-phosphate thymidylyltransferase RfbA [Candidatus Paceibacterota bacterium]|jgi:glucose-1-phosphate thymidylyltransferase